MKLSTRYLLLTLLTTLYFLSSIYRPLPTTHYLLPTVHARGIGMAVSKNIYDISISPGGTYHGDLTVFNESVDAPLPVHLQLALWDLDEKTDDYEFVSAEESINPVRWFSIESPDVIIGDSSTKEIRFDINVPKDTPPGTYLAMMIVQSALPDFYFDGGNTRFVPEIGLFFFIKVAPLSIDGAADEYGADIISIEAGEGSGRIGLLGNILPKAEAGVFDEAVGKLIAKIKNTGVYHFKASGYVEIKNIFGTTVARANIPEKYLLPGKTRPIAIDIFPPPDTEGLSAAARILKTITWKLKTSAYIGPYSATVTLAIPNGAPVAMSTNFWVIPWQFWGVVLIFTGGTLLCWRRYRKRIFAALKVLFGPFAARK